MDERARGKGVVSMTKENEKYFDRAYIALTPLNSFLICQHDERMDLKEMQDMVEGDIEIVPTVIASHWADEKGVSILMVVNEEGKLHGMDWNPMATTLCGYLLGHVAGNALIVGSKYGRLIALKRSAAEEIMRVFRLGHAEIKESGLTIAELSKKAEEEEEEA